MNITVSPTEFPKRFGIESRTHKSTFEVDQQDRHSESIDDAASISSGPFVKRSEHWYRSRLNNNEEVKMAQEGTLHGYRQSADNRVAQLASHQKDVADGVSVKLGGTL